VLGEARRLQQIVWNLLSNAVKFSDPGGEIAVTLVSRRDNIRLQVSDTGHGISPSFLPYVFDRFKQSDASSARRQGGLGLGLALVRELVELHGGCIQAESAGLNKGSVFTIDLPALSRAHDDVVPGALKAAADVPDSASLSGVSILVVEDDGDSRELMTAILTKAGAQVHTVASSDDALACLTAADGGVFDAIVSDIGMPNHDGYELMRRVRALPSPRLARLPALAVTGYATDTDRGRAGAAGYTAHVAKPIDSASLVAEVLRALRAHAAGG
jgi:CheY-like chemotaxis protein